ncbi:MAG: hypothetical protein IB617_02160 [Candidatus Nealsonbacteria bacterium]|nr:MAG: hypothetical protein IB617_02160 [Candidatus Nealsonbacteria bacterium]
MKEKIKKILKLGFISTLMCLGLVFLIAIISPDSSLLEEKLPASIHEGIEKEQPPLNHKRNLKRKNLNLNPNPNLSSNQNLVLI